MRELLTSEDRANGFSVTDSHYNITLLKWSKPVAWFSVALSEETLRAFIEVVKDYERNEGAI